MSQTQNYRILKLDASTLWCPGFEALPRAPTPAPSTRGSASLLAEGTIPGLSHMSPGSAQGGCNQCFILFLNPQVTCPSSADTHFQALLEAKLRFGFVSSCSLCPPLAPLPAHLTVTPPALAYQSFQPSLGAGEGTELPSALPGSACPEAAAARNSELVAPEVNAPQL